MHVKFDMPKTKLIIATSESDGQSCPLVFEMKELNFIVEHSPRGLKIQIDLTSLKVRDPTIEDAVK